MKISTKGRYGLRLMLDLAMHSDEGHVSLKEISARQEISEKYLEQIMILLNRASLVRSVRGSQGGYMLFRPAKEITVGDILRTTEGSLAPVECVESAHPDCPMSSACVTIDIWRQIKEAVENIVDNTTLADLADRSREKNINDYVI